jgi:hypothetical protein
LNKTKLKPPQQKNEENTKKGRINRPFFSDSGKRGFQKMSNEGDEVVNELDIGEQIVNGTCGCAE